MAYAPAINCMTYRRPGCLAQCQLKSWRWQSAEVTCTGMVLLLLTSCMLCRHGVLLCSTRTMFPSSSKASSGAANIMPASARAALSPSLLKDRSSCFSEQCRPAAATPQQGHRCDWICYSHYRPVNKHVLMSNVLPEKEHLQQQSLMY